VDNAELFSEGEISMKRMILVVCLLTAGFGCGEFTHLDLHELSGTITREGKPVAAGGLIFIPEQTGGKAMTINASVRDGAFRGMTDRTSASGKSKIEPGVPAGSYRAVYHPASDGSKSNLEMDLGKIEVAAGGTVIDLKLPEKMPMGVGEPRDDAHKGAETRD
jgi:hypothetical protein